MRTENNEEKQGTGPLSAPPCSAFFQAKVAFEIPSQYVRDGIYDKLVERLMDLFEDTEFESGSICTPALLILNTHEIPTPDWVAECVKRINAVLPNDTAQAPDGPKETL